MIRRFTKNDSDRLIELWYDASKIAHSFLSEDFLEKESILMRHLYLEEAETWVYEKDGIVAGFISMIDNEIGGLFVDPSFQRCGIGGELIDHIGRYDRKLVVDVFKANDAGCNFYYKYGFQKIGELVHRETGNIVVRMKYVYSAK
ncbi:MAG: GNAT family N-acetyltransferase [Melioribacteraceae bacterium]|nr:GNAT family N-acetyltransferase [Melioribacteraceae bacterium]